MGLGKTKFEKFMFRFSSNYRIYRIKRHFNNIPKKTFTGMALWYMVWTLKMRLRTFKK
ncbi:MAG: hypothetical protein H8E55_13065 [Pelagibacterales bacterium]|nr:hypothetical protein [Pelagibacterales bacterium]